MPGLTQTQAAYLTGHQDPVLGPVEAGIEAELAMQESEAELLAQFMHPHIYSQEES